MIKFLRKHGKPIMAVLGVALMVIFIIPPSAKNGRTSTRRPIGHIGTQAVYVDDKAQAVADWQLLGDLQTARVFAQVPYLPSRYDYSLTPDLQRAPCMYLLGFGLTQAIEANPELYFLLQQEARQRGIVTSPDELGSVMVNDFFGRDFGSGPTSSGFRLSPDSVGGQENYDQFSAAVGRFLPVLTLVREVESSAKTTLPMWDHLAANRQQVRVAIVEMAADRFKAAVGVPTPEQMQTQYDKYKDVVPQPAAQATGLNFGYKLPDRVRVQYLKIPRDKVLDAIRATKPAYDWKVDAVDYYRSHLEEFVGLPPETQPATKPTTAPTTLPIASTSPTTSAVATTAPTTHPTTVAAVPPPPAPTTRPFEEVQERATLAVLASPADELTQKIQAAIVDRLTKDYLASRSSTPLAGVPATLPADGLASKAHLDEIAVDIQKEFNVLPEVNQPGDWLDTGGLTKLPGIGTAFADNDSIASIASIAIPATQPALGATPLPPLATLLPSQPLRDPNQNVYVFRVVQRDPSHTSPLKDVSVAVATDVQTAHMYQAALDAAKALLEASKKHGLSAAAGLQNLPVITTPTPFMPGGEIPGYSVSPQSSQILAQKISDLRKDASASDPHPMAVVELPGEKKTLVVQLIDLVSPLKPEIAYFGQLVSTHEQDAQLREGIGQKYFSYDAVKARLHYVAESDKSGS